VSLHNHWVVQPNGYIHTNVQRVKLLWGLAAKFFCHYKQGVDGHTFSLNGGDPDNRRASRTFKSLRLKKGERLLIRGGTTSVGLAAIAKSHGAFVAAMTRNPDREKLLRASGVDQVFIDSGAIAEQVQEVCPKQSTKSSNWWARRHSLRQTTRHRLYDRHCRQQWWFDNFVPMEAIPTAVSLTTYAGESEDFMRTPLEDLVEKIAAGTLHVQVGKTFHLDEIAEAHRCMEENKAGGKIVVLI
jgi:NADPH:quinone reductase-like Zn-dependent oxidoreductase